MVDENEEHKLKFFTVMKGQCNLGLKSELESMSKCKEMAENNDVKSSLELTKQMLCSMSEVGCEHWMMTVGIK